MGRIDWLILRRIFAKIALVFLIFYGLIALVESLDSYRYNIVANSQGEEVALLAIFAAGARWSIKILPITVLIGTIIAILDMQSHRELIIIKASGFSIWRILSAPIITLLIISAAISFAIEAEITKLNRSIFPAYQTTNPTIGKDRQIWLVQYANGEKYIFQGYQAASEKYKFRDVTIYFDVNYLENEENGEKYSQIRAKSAILEDKNWLLEGVELIAANKAPQMKEKYILPTKSTVSELVLKFSSTDDFTFLELKEALSKGLSDPLAQSEAATRYAKLLAFPFLLVGSLLIAFAFSSKYKRKTSYASAIIGGIVLGFIIFVLNEMADRAGASAILNPLIAGWGPAIIAILVGVTLLLYREDGFV